MMKIGQIAKQVDLPASTIRYYEQIGILPKPARESGQRNYSENSIDLLQVIKMARGLGYSLAEIKPLLDAFQTSHQASPVCHEITRKKLIELDKLINQMKKIKSVLIRGLDCDCVNVCECYLHPRQSEVNLVLLSQLPTYSTKI